MQKNFEISKRSFINYHYVGPVKLTKVKKQANMMIFINVIGEKLKILAQNY
jgi:hypothetical protein